MNSFIQNTFENQGLDIQYVVQCFKGPEDPDSGWPMRLPDIEPGKILVLHFQDNVNPKNGRILELDAVEQHYGSQSHLVNVVYWSHGLDRMYSGPLNVFEYSWHNVHTAESVLSRETEWRPFFKQPRTRAWQSLNGKWNSHRARVSEVLRNWPNGVHSFADVIPLPVWDYNSTYRGGTDNDENFVRLASIYADCAVNVVTETQYNERPGIVSEKTMLALIAGQIPVVIGHPGVVQDCRELGFDMFDDLVDTSYDWLPNNIRVEEALNKNKNLILGKIDLAPYQKRLKRQSEFVLKTFPRLAEQRLINQVSAKYGATTQRT